MGAVPRREVPGHAPPHRLTTHQPHHRKDTAMRLLYALGIFGGFAIVAFAIYRDFIH